MLSVGKLLFFILMPLIYILIQVIFFNSKYNKKRKIIINSLLLLIYYSIELTYIFVLHFISKEWIFMKGITIPPESFVSFVMLSIMFIIFHFAIMAWEGDSGFCHVIVLVILFGFFLALDADYVQYNIDTKIFNEMPYEKTNEYTIKLKALSDTHTTEGKIAGGRFYINGTIKDNYEIYYSFIDEKGSTVIRHFPYSEQNVEIYEIDNCPNPRIEFTEYYKEYKDNKSSYTHYIIYIPTGTNNTTIDME